jgi:hypothetical protein
MRCFVIAEDRMGGAAASDMAGCNDRRRRDAPPVSRRLPTIPGPSLPRLPPCEFRHPGPGIRHREGGWGHIIVERGVAPDGGDRQVLPRRSQCDPRS